MIWLAIQEKADCFRRYDRRSATDRRTNSASVGTLKYFPCDRESPF